MSPTTWYVARAGGLVAFALLSLTVVLGLSMSGRMRSGRWPRFALEDVHRFAGLATAAFIGIHGVSILLDSYVNYSVVDVLVPGAAPTKSLATALGIVGAELLAALAVTNRFRARLPYRFWRRAHYGFFAVWTLALAHGLAAGTDSTAPWALGLYTLAGSAVAGLTVWRIVGRRTVPSWGLRLWPAAAALLCAELLVAVDLGPLHG